MNKHDVQAETALSERELDEATGGFFLEIIFKAQVKALVDGMVDAATRK